MPKRTQKDYRLRSGEYRRDGSIFDRYGNVVGTYGTNRRAVPPGLAKKPGGMPPGQLKKQMRDGYYR
ncbi:MAG TPA: hypothetical protein VMZ52_11970 [Bryobacteraceae bacterium]|nr:hypothetical protein [Bryobacteraceae bacterium]